MSESLILARVDPGALIFFAIVLIGALRGLAIKSRKAASRRSLPRDGTTGAEPPQSPPASGDSQAAPVRYTVSDSGQVSSSGTPSPARPSAMPKPPPPSGAAEPGAKASRPPYRKPSVEDLLRGPK